MKFVKVTSILCTSIISLLSTGCSSINEQSLIDDLSNGGYNVEGYNSSFDDVYDINNTYYFTDPYSSDYGYVYELDEDLNEFYENRLEYSFNVNDIVFIYKIDNYVLEIYHGLTSTFPGFIRHYEFESNYQYQLYNSNETVLHPILINILDKGSFVEKIYTESEIEHSRTSFTTSTVPIYNMYRIKSNDQSDHIFSIIVLETDSIESAETIYTDLHDLVFPGNNVYVYVQYQNLVFRISTTYTSYEEINEYLFDEVSFITYNMLSTD